MRTDEFDFDLPAGLIAQFPSAERRASRLLHVSTQPMDLADRLFSQLPALVQPGDVLVFNDTRVIRARLFGRKASGGQIELLVERILDDQHALCFIRASHAPKPGGRLLIGHDDIELEVIAREGDMYHLRFHGSLPVMEVLDHHGSLPLPPYIERQPGADDDERYQTVYARQPGAVAAPTAGLHFDEAMLAELDRLGVIRTHVTLHVGAGTFQPVRVEQVKDHVMHSERYDIPQHTTDAIAQAQRTGRRVMAVGTTSLRALEAAAQSGPLVAGQGETRIFITPGYRFRVVDRLLTNFHLPRSTLMMLVSAFAGMDTIRHAYQHAINQRYRFFSYGDAMLLERQPEP